MENLLHPGSSQHINTMLTAGQPAVASTSDIYNSYNNTQSTPPTQNTGIMQKLFVQSAGIIINSKSAALKTLLCLLVISASTVFTNTAAAQDLIHVSQLTKDKSTATWHSLRQVGGVEISYQYVDCGPVEYVLFKITNSSSAKTTVSWTYHKPAVNKEVAASAQDRNVSLVIPAGSSVAGDCSFKNTDLMLFVREAGRLFTVPEIELTNIKTTITQ